MSGPLFDDADKAALHAAVDAMWFTSGPRTAAFEKALARKFGMREAVFCNSGSSANLLALSALDLKPGDEVITAACGFPTTVNPIVQCGATPVFIDSELETYNAELDHLAAAFSERTRGVIIAHTLGNPFDGARVRDFCDRRGLFFIADCCDAFGVRVDADFATCSFFPAHHITTGEGGAVLTNSPLRRKVVESYRDWGRDCWCKPGDENTCGKRFCWDLGTLPPGYDHKYTYSRIGYNLKATELQAALGLSQLDKADAFLAKRRSNAKLLLHLLDDLDGIRLPGGDPDENAWFGVPLRVPGGCAQMVAWLESQGIRTRPLFAGNLTRHPAYRSVAYRTVGTLRNADLIAEEVFWVGCHPALGDAEMHTIAAAVRSYYAGYPVLA